MSTFTADARKAAAAGAAVNRRATRIKRKSKGKGQKAKGKSVSIRSRRDCSVALLIFAIRLLPFNFLWGMVSNDSTSAVWRATNRRTVLFFFLHSALALAAAVILARKSVHIGIPRFVERIPIGWDTR